MENCIYCKEQPIKSIPVYGKMPDGTKIEKGIACLECVCEKCGELLGSSQYARIKREGEPAANARDNLACRNYPDCEKAEKEV